VLSNSLTEASAAAFFLPFNQEYDVNTQRPSSEQVGDSASNC
jgi:hypothetical protein